VEGIWEGVYWKMRLRFEVGKMRIGSESDKWINNNWMLKYPPERNCHPEDGFITLVRSFGSSQLYCMVL
jgi:hypothetical protein